MNFTRRYQACTFHVMVHSPMLGESNNLHICTFRKKNLLFFSNLPIALSFNTIFRLFKLKKLYRLIDFIMFALFSPFG